MNGIASRLRQIDWMRTLLTFCVLAMEACWVSPWIPLFDDLLGVEGRHHATLGVYAFVVMTFFVGRAMLAARLPHRLRPLILGVLIALTTLGLVWVELYADQPLLSLGWLRSFVHSLINISHRLPPTTTLLGASLYLWGQGLALSEGSLLTDTITARFRRGFMGLALYALVALLGRLSVPWETFGFFFFGIASTALARLLESKVRLGDWEGRRRWLAFLLGASAATLGIGWLGHTLLSASDFGLTGLTLTVLYEVFSLLIGYLGMLPGYLLDWLISSAEAFLSNRPFPAFELPAPFAETVGKVPEPAGTGGLEAFCSTAAPILLVGLLILAVLVIARRRNQGWRAGPPADDVERESLGIGRSSLADSWQGVVNAARRLRLIPRYSTRSVRRIYASLVAYALELGYPCDETRTPHELLPVLQGAFPSAQDEVRQITEAYIRVHYGERPETRDDLEQAREGWKRIQQRDVERWGLGRGRRGRHG